MPVTCAAAFWLTNFASPGIGLHPGDQLVERVRRQILLGDHELRIDRDQPDRLEILLQVVVQVVDDAADVGVPLADVDGVAVGRRARDAADRDAAAGAADVLDDDRLAEERPHLLCQDARRGVGRAAGRKRHDQRDRCATERSARARRRRPASKMPATARTSFFTMTSRSRFRCNACRTRRCTAPCCFRRRL